MQGRPDQDMSAGRRWLIAVAAVLALPAMVLSVSVLSSAPAFGQSGAVNLPIAPVLACQEDHFDPERYRADLLAAGWQVAPNDDRSDIVMRLADAFEPLAEPPRGDETLATRRSANRAGWFRLTAERTLMARPGAVLFLTGLTSEDGQRAIECWVALAEGTLVEGLFEAALDSRDDLDAGTVSVIEYGPFDLPAGGAFSLLATRQAPNASADPSETPALIASHGFMTRTVFQPSD